MLLSGLDFSYFVIGVLSLKYIIFKLRIGQDPTTSILFIHPLLNQDIYVSLQEMQVLVELGDKELEDQHVDNEEGHLDEVPQVHRLEPHSVGEPIRTDVLLQVSVMVKAPLALKVLMTVKLAKEQVVICRAVLEERTANVHLGAPSVLNHPVRDLGLHGLVHPKFSHEIQRAKVLIISLLQKQAYFMRLVNIV